MKVKELIEQLSIYSPDAEVRVYTSNNDLFISDVVPHKDKWTHEQILAAQHAEIAGLVAHGPNEDAEELEAWEARYKQLMEWFPLTDEDNCDSWVELILLHVNEEISPKTMEDLAYYMSDIWDLPYEDRRDLYSELRNSIATQLSAVREALAGVVIKWVKEREMITDEQMDEMIRKWRLIYFGM